MRWLRGPIGGGVIAVGIIGVVWLAQMQIGQNRNELARLEGLARTQEETFQVILNNQRILLDAVNPQSCLARRGAYNTALLVVQIINDNRAIHGEDPVKPPAKPADYDRCPTYVPRVDASRPRPKAEASQGEAPGSPPRREPPSQKPRSPKPSPSPGSPGKSLVCRLLPFLPPCR